MGKDIDITKQKFGLLTALNVDHKTKWDEHWLCQCGGAVELPSENFMAQIRNKYLGVYKNPQEAHDVYTKEVIKEYGEFICVYMRRTN